ncbi:hypothetical protein [Rhizobium sp. FY34]|uniref:hypothetical protein n=1 Tax=Rhizobium sp. FY34 TaxID=2562309 RepID=UPI0010BFF74F|nr:hypothetical protein [Rhizobium sp. FY34]
MAEALRDAGATVRHFELDDIPAVARLFLKTFRKGRAASATPSPVLLAQLRQIYFETPWYDPQIRSWVFVDEAGEVHGFIGANVVPMEYEGRPLRVAYAGALTVEDSALHPLAGARLLRSFLSGPQDISVTETANATAARMWQKQGIPLNTAYSLNWIRLLRPAAGAMSILERKLPAARLLSPLAHGIDWAFARMLSDPLRPRVEASPRRLSFQTVERSEFDAAALHLKDFYALRPRWDAPSLHWFSSHAAVKRNFGEPRYRLALGRDGQPASAYAYFRRRDDFAWMLQSLVTPEQAGDLVDDMLLDADSYGCAGIRGAAQPWLNAALMSRKSLFLSRTFFLAHARDKTLLQPFLAGEALASGLAGESWMRLIGDDFRD